jgi:hypothetical protein
MSERIVTQHDPSALVVLPVMLESVMALRNQGLQSP